MAAGEFNPDLLLTVGADVSALRQQLAQISRELNIPPVQIKVEAPASSIQQTNSALTEMTRQSEAAGGATAKLLGQLSAVLKVARELEIPRYIINPQAFQTSIEGAERVRAALATIAKTTQEVTTGTEQGKLAWAEFSNAVTVVRLETERLVAIEKDFLKSQEATTAQIELNIKGIKAQNAEMAELAANYRKQEAAEETQATRRITQLTQIRTLMAELQKLEVRAGTATAASSAASANLGVALGGLQAGGAPFSPSELAALKDAAAAAKIELQGINATRVEGNKIAATTAALDRQISRDRLADAAQDKQILLDRERQLTILQTRLRELAALETRAGRGLGVSGSLAGNVASTRASIIGNITALSGGGDPLDDVAMAKFLRQFNELKGQLQAAGAESHVFGGALDGLGTRMFRTTAVVGGLTIAFGLLRGATAFAREFIELDDNMHRIAATMDLSKDRASVLQGSMELLRDANSKLGVGFADSSKVLLELQKALDNDAELVKGAFIPALVLAQSATGNQADVIKLLVGAYFLYGDSIGKAADASQRFKEIAGLLLSAEAASIRDVNDFVTSLGSAASAGKNAGVEFKQTLAYLILLTNGLQSASKAGTELRSIYALFQSRAPQIVAAFDLKGFDINGVIPVDRLLSDVIQKLAITGTRTQEVQLQMERAFGTGGGGRGGGPKAGLEVLVALNAKLQQSLAALEDPLARFARAQEEASQKISSALGRLQGQSFQGLLDFFNQLFSFTPGSADGLVHAIDGAKEALRGFFDGIENDIAQLQKLKILLGEIASGRATPVDIAGQLFYEATGRNVPGAGLSPQARLDLLQVDLSRPSVIRQQQIENQGYDLSAGTTRGQAQAVNSLLSSQYEKRLQELKAFQQAEFNATNQQLSGSERIAAAREVESFRLKELEAAEERFRQGRLNNVGKDAKAIEEMTGAVLQARQSYNAALRQTRQIEIDNDLLQIKAINDQMDRERDRGKLVVETREQISAQLKAALGQDLEAYKAEQEGELRAQTDKLKTLSEGSAIFRPDSEHIASVEIGDQQTLIGIEEYRLKVTQNLRKEQVTAFTESQAALQGLGFEVGKVNILFGQMATAPGGALKIATSGFQNETEAVNALVNKALGIDKVIDQARELAATFGLVGAEAARATIAARLGFQSYQELLDAAEKIKAGGGPKTEQQRGIVAGADVGAPNAYAAQQKLIIEQAKNQYAQLSQQQQIVAVTFGKTTEEVVRQSLSISKTGRTWEELSASIDENDKKQAEWFDKVAKATAEGKRQEEVLSLMAAGFDSVTAAMIQATNEQDRIDFANLKRAADSVEEFNTRAQRMQEILGKIAEESARQSGNPFAYYLLSLKNASDKSNEFWASLKTLAEDTAKNLQQSFSDFFFDAFTGKLQTATQLWNNFLTSMLRALSDFMSKQLVRSFLNIILGGSTGGAGGAGSGGDGTPPGAMNLLGGAVGGIGNIFSNYSAGGLSAVLTGSPAVPNVVTTTTSRSDQLRSNDPNLAQGQVDIGRPATTGILGTGGNISKDLSSAGAVLAAYTAAQSVIKLTSDLSTQSQRNSGTGGLVGGGVGGIIGALFGGTAGASIGAGAGGLLGSYLGGLFGSNAPPAGRFDEINRTISTVQTSLEAMISGAKTFTDLFTTLQGFQGGGALAGATGQPVSLAVGGQPISGLTQSQFLSAVRANPSSLTASVQAGVNPSLLGPLNQEVVSAILTRIQALDQIGQELNKTIADILAETVVPTPTGGTSLETLKQQAVDFRAVVDNLIATNASQTQALEAQLAATTDPALVLQYTTTIKGLIEQRYQDETQLVQKFAGQLDTLATSLKNVSQSIDKQIFDLQLSNFGPTNPLAGLQLAQGKFDTAKSAFFANPTPENAQALQALVDPLLQAASQVFTRPSPEYRAIYDDVINTLEQVKASVDSQVSDIQSALQTALGTSNSIADLTQHNTASMAADMKQLLAIVTASAAASGINLNAGTGILLPGTFPASGQPVQPYQNQPSTNTGNQTAAGLSAAGVLGVLGGLAGPAITVADKLGLVTPVTDWIKQQISSLFGPGPTIAPATASNYFTNPTGSVATDFNQVAPSSLDSTLNALSNLNFTIQMPSVTLDLGALGTYDFSSLGSSSTYAPNDINAFQSGGHVPGVGSGDIVPAMLEPGEFVIPKRIAGRMRPMLEALIGGNKSIPTGPNGLHFADGGSVPLSSQDIQGLLLLQALLGVNHTQSMSQQQIAANTALTAAILQQLAQRSGISARGATSVVSMPSTPNIIGSSSASGASPSGGLPLSALFARLVSAIGSPSAASVAGAGTSLPSLQGLLSPTSSQLAGVARTSAGQTFPNISVPGPTGASFFGPLSAALQSGSPSQILAAGAPLLNLLSTVSTLQAAASGGGSMLGGGGPSTLGSIFGLISGGTTLAGGISSNNIFQTLQGGLGTISSLSDLIQLATNGAVPGLTSVLSDLISNVATSVGIDVLPTDAIPYAGAVIKAVMAAIQIAEVASSNASDEEKAIQAAEIAAKTVAVLAAGPTFGASLAVTQIIDFIERMRAGQSFTQSIVSANDPTAILGGQSGISGQIFYPSMDWQMFGTHLAENFQKGGLDLKRLVDMINYVQSKEELGAVINSYRSWVQSDTGWSWYGQDTPDPYKIPSWPEAGGSAHEGGLTISFSDPVNQIQALIDQLLQILPGNRITSLGYFNTGLAGQLQGQMFTQQHAADYAGGLQQVNVVTGYSGEAATFGTEIQGNALPVWAPDGNGGITASLFNSSDLFNAIQAGTISGSPIYDPRTGQFGYTWPGVTAAALGIPDAAGLLAPFYRNFGQSTAPTTAALAALTAPNITTLNQIRPMPSDPGYMDWLAANDPNAYQQALQQMYLQMAMSNGDGGGFAAGGWTSGGIRGRDSIPALLGPDEFVVPANVARANAGLLEGLTDGTVRSDFGSTISAAARSGGYHSAGGVSQVVLNIHPGAINVDGAKDPKASAREIMDLIEQNIRTGRLGQVVVTRVRQQRS